MNEEVNSQPENQDVGTEPMSSDQANRMLAAYTAISGETDDIRNALASLLSITNNYGFAMIKSNEVNARQGKMRYVYNDSDHQLMKYAYEPDVNPIVDGKCNNSNNKNSMKESQRVYIKGDSKRGDEIIKLLEDLGGNNTFPCEGKDEKAIYFINPQGEIDWTYDSNRSMIFPYIKEFYKEIKLPESNPIKSKGHKQFSPFQKVLIKIFIYGKTTWMAAIYSHYDSSHNKHYLTNLLARDDKDIIPYEGNKDKLGKITDESEY